MVVNSYIKVLKIDTEAGFTLPDTTDRTGESWQTTSSLGAGTVTAVGVTTANGVSGSVANPTTTPAITLTLGDITPTSVVASGAVSGSNLSGTNTGDQQIFKTIAVAGQYNVVADTTTDTLTLVGSGVTITTDASTDTVTFTVTGGGTIDGSGTTNELPYWVDSNTLGTLAVATYPSLTEVSYVKGVTSAIQTQLGTKAPSTAPTFATSITGSYLTPSEILITDGSKNIVSAPVATYPSLAELAYVKGVTGAIQTQIASASNPTVNMAFPKPLYGDDCPSGSGRIWTNDNLGVFGAVVVPHAITASKLSFNVTALTSGTPTVAVAIYSEDGQTRLVHITTAAITGVGAVTTAISPAVFLPAGIYYIGMVPTTASGFSITIDCYAGTGDTDGLCVIAGEPNTEGDGDTLDGVLPATITTTDLSFSGSALIPEIRLDA